MWIVRVCYIVCVIGVEYCVEIIINVVIEVVCFFLVNCWWIDNENLFGIMFKIKLYELWMIDLKKCYNNNKICIIIMVFFFFEIYLYCLMFVFC